MNPAGSLFDEAKLNDVSKNVISMFSADEVVEKLLVWAKKFDGVYFELLNNQSFQEKITAIFYVYLLDIIMFFLKFQNLF